MLNLVVGPYAELEQALADRIRALRSGGADPLAPVAILAPSRRLLAHLQRALVRDHHLALANASFDTFQSFARRLLIEAGIPAGKLAEAPGVEERLVERALDRLPPLHPLRDLMATPGLLGSLLSTIRDLDEARVTAAALEDPALEDVRGTGDLAVISVLLEELERERAALGLLDRAGVVAAAAELAPRSAWLAAHKGLFHYGAYDLTQHQLDWLLALGAAVPVTALFPALPEREGRLPPAHRFAEATLSAIRMKAVEESWEHAPRAMPQSEGLEAGDPSEEFELIAEHIRELGEKDIRPAEIVVVARSLEESAAAAAAAFARAGVPCETSAPVPLAALPAGRGLLALARALAGGADPATVVELVAQDWLRGFDGESNPDGEGPARPLSRAAALSRRLPPFAGSAEWEELAAAADPERDSGRLDIAVARQVARGLAEIEAEARGFPAHAPWSGFVDRWTAGLEALAPAPGIHEPALTAGLEAVEELRRLDAVEPGVSAGAFHARVTRTLERASLPLRDRRGGVRLLSAMDARGVRPRVLYLAALNDGVFPRVAHEDPFLRDDARRALNDPLGYKIQTKREDGAAEERLLFDLLASAPSARLVLSWHAEDGRGRPAAVSPLVPPLLGGDPGMKQARDRARDLRSRARAAALRAANPERAARSVRVMRELDLPPDSGPTDRDGPPALKRPSKLRVTSLRDLAKCPFRVYVGTALGAESPRGPDDWWDPESWRIGNALHAALDQGLKALFEGRRADPKSVASVHVSESLARHVPALSRLPVLRAALERELSVLVEDALADQQEFLAASGLHPDTYEKRYELPFEAGGIVLSFQADRLDRGPNGAAHVADYKSHSGRSSHAGKSKLDPDALQVSLYLHLLAPSAPPAFSIIHLGSGLRPRVQPVRPEPELARSISGSALALSATLARHWREGRASPWPSDLLRRSKDWQARCEYCDLRTLCRSDHLPTRARLERSAELEALRAALPGGDDGDGAAEGGES